MSILFQPIQLTEFAIYTISDDNIEPSYGFTTSKNIDKNPQNTPKNTGPQNSYTEIQNYLNGVFDVILIDTLPKSISLNVMNMIYYIQNNMHKNYKGIYLMGWGTGCSVITQVAYIINNFIKPSYVLGNIYLAPQQAETELINYLDIKCVFVHGKLDNIQKYTISENLYKNYNNTNKEIILLDNQDHKFTHNSSNITEVIYNIFSKIYNELNNIQPQITYCNITDGLNYGYMDCSL